MQQDIVLKILSGPMFGVDVELPDDNVHLFFCDSDAIEQSNAGSVYQYAINTLLIPCAKGANEKILLRLSKQESDDHTDGVTEATAQRIPPEDLQTEAAVSEIAADDDSDIVGENSKLNADSQRVDIIPVPLNQPVNIGHAVIALKPACEEWSKEVTQYYYPVSAQNNDAQAQVIPVPVAEQKRRFAFKYAFGGLICLAGAAVLFALFTPNKVGTLKETLSPINPGISQHKSGKIYVLTQTQPEAVWAEKALRKSNLSASNINVIAETVELARMKRILSEHVIPFFNVKYNASTFTLNLQLSQERSAGRQHIDKTVRDLLIKEFPYLTTINIQRISDNEVLANAAERLKSMGLYSQKDIAANHVTFSISGEVDDVQLGTLRRQVNEFYDQYGDQYVKFVVNLNEDPLRNRTFKTGVDSYVVIPGNHWLYSDIFTTR
ncbi:hypothetical protein C3432_01970 [Citrobacter amalonaticus]|uniref:PrgH/EprH family type III secretion apparatus protein n=1 Tax=Citrobacter amalonaticus TaxID=35703 RepID=A0A2S4S2K4_CITAM|nr:PrgH/EprH family type III secretion apparatus protein [Citrobacter amalonaticus]POT59513.1 hypothetical protein C3432_01970 [Citrobacter amalonaticus]POT77643.1 hypothetical protein C3436_09640 [Citrobacter amalonaticus]POU68095.1 hypothetical protein C3430_03175 [Citrobacter amalonaticus]POV07699.1 hypothetical protein C3424_03185 [Citrobacter amalonaticus]